jgi:hypothetical protein
VGQRDVRIDPITAIATQRDRWHGKGVSAGKASVPVTKQDETDFPQSSGDQIGVAIRIEITGA